VQWADGGSRALEVLVQLTRSLQSAGEERFCQTARELVGNCRSLAWLLI
jgi:hypothetical protein